MRDKDSQSRHGRRIGGAGLLETLDQSPRRRLVMAGLTIVCFTLVTIHFLADGATATLAAPGIPSFAVAELLSRHGSGVAEVTCGEDVYPLATNESTYIPVETKHRLANRSNELLVLIEVQCGDYLGEDDIVRFEDRYGRA